MVDVTLLYFDGCPNWRTADDNLRSALGEVGVTTAKVHYRRVGSVEEAQALRFIGSPTVLIDGVDPFDDPHASVGLSCRPYPDAGWTRGHAHNRAAARRAGRRRKAICREEKPGNGEPRGLIFHPTRMTAQ